MKNFLVAYLSRSGKTKKIAEAIAQELECEIVNLKKQTPDDATVGMLIVGSGTYVGKPDKQILEFINNLENRSHRKAAVFVTSGFSNPKTSTIMKKALEKKGYTVVSSFDCRGQFTLKNRGHPNKDDLRDAKAFASTLYKKY